jgi:hypothetical protein
MLDESLGDYPRFSLVFELTEKVLSFNVNQEKSNAGISPSKTAGSVRYVQYFFMTAHGFSFDKKDMN